MSTMIRRTRKRQHSLCVAAAFAAVSISGELTTISFSGIRMSCLMVCQSLCRLFWMRTSGRCCIWERSEDSQPRRHLWLLMLMPGYPFYRPLSSSRCQFPVTNEWRVMFESWARTKRTSRETEHRTSWKGSASTGCVTVLANGYTCQSITASSISHRRYA